MRRPISALLLVVVTAACANTSGVTVRGVEANDLLKLRKGPGLDQEIILGLPNGTALRRHGCGEVAGKLWCKVSLREKPAVTGYVAADYLAVR